MTQIRDAEESDLGAILAIFNAVIASSTAVYRDEPVPLEERRAWFEARRARAFPVLVAEQDGAVVGFASYGPYRDYWGYRFTVEHTVHIDASARRGGVGTALVAALVERAEAQGLHLMLGAVDGENAGSIRFHEKLGFEQSGRIREVGCKFGRWLDVVFMQKRLGPGA
jgi:phosphinothricin acetyltransferase